MQNAQIPLELFISLLGQRKILVTGSAPAVSFALTGSEKPVAVHAYCNIHGLRKADNQIKHNNRMPQSDWLLESKSDRGVFVI